MDRTMQGVKADRTSAAGGGQFIPSHEGKTQSAQSAPEQVWPIIIVTLWTTALFPVASLTQSLAQLHACLRWHHYSQDLGLAHSMQPGLLHDKENVRSSRVGG